MPTINPVLQGPPPPGSTEQEPSQVQVTERVPPAPPLERDCFFDPGTQPGFWESLEAGMQGSANGLAAVPRTAPSGSQAAVAAIGAAAEMRRRHGANEQCVYQAPPGMSEFDHERLSQDAYVPVSELPASEIEWLRSKGILPATEPLEPQTAANSAEDNLPQYPSMKLPDIFGPPKPSESVPKEAIRKGELENPSPAECQNRAQQLQRHLVFAHSAWVEGRLLTDPESIRRAMSGGDVGRREIEATQQKLARHLGKAAVARLKSWYTPFHMGDEANLEAKIANHLLRVYQHGQRDPNAPYIHPHWFARAPAEWRLPLDA